MDHMYVVMDCDVEKSCDVVESVGKKRAFSDEELGPHAVYPDGRKVTFRDLLEPAVKKERKTTFGGSESFKYLKLMPESLLRERAIAENVPIVVELYCVI